MTFNRGQVGSLGGHRFMLRARRFRPNRQYRSGITATGHSENYRETPGEHRPIECPDQQGTCQQCTCPHHHGCHARVGLPVDGRRSHCPATQGIGRGDRRRLVRVRPSRSAQERNRRRPARDFCMGRGGRVSTCDPRNARSATTPRVGSGRARARIPSTQRRRVPARQSRSDSADRWYRGPRGAFPMNRGARFLTSSVADQQL
jgi:hypothetical protein